MRKFTLTLAILKEWHNKFNAEYFNNELSMPKFKLVNADSFFGQYMHSGVIKMSVHRDRTEREFQNTFLHEMVHQWQKETNKFGDFHKDRGHGYWFKLKAKELNRYGWEIQRCSSSHGAKVVSGLEKKRRTKRDFDQTYMFIWTNKGKKLFRHIRPTCLENMKDIVKHNPDFYGCASLYLIEYTYELKRHYREAVSSLGGYDYYNSKEMVDRLIAEGEKLSL